MREETPGVAERALDTEQRILQAIGYHQQTKHHFFRYARALGYMDWANQPDPFRRFAGAALHRLPLLSPADEPVSSVYDDVFSGEAITAQPITQRTLSRFFEYALSITAWKEAGGVRWALRSNPSSGNLHPTEGYVLIDGLQGLDPTPGLYHYAAKEHGLERRADWPVDLFRRMIMPFPPSAFLLALTSVHWREAWKYGERAYRYCQHDAGHAVATCRVAAAVLGWRMLLLEDTGDELLAALLGVDREDDFAGAEREHPDCLAVVWPKTPGRVTIPLGVRIEASHVRDRVVWHGRANRLSRGKPDPWDIIDVVTEACIKPPAPARAIDVEAPLGVKETPAPPRRIVTAGRIIHQRRSALAFDGKTALPADQFFGLLSRVMPCHEQPIAGRPVPWDVWPWDPALDLGLFVHRIDGLAPGLYWLARDPARGGSLRQIMHPHFLWSRPDGCPEGLPLYLLEEGDAQRLAAQVSCHQEIAGAGAFSLGMIAEFDERLRRHGAWFYRRLFWESGLIGQVLYLEAEAAGVRATGIGCFFDDPVHQVFGLTDLRFQSLYHFTVGGPVDDPRLTTLPAYEEREVR